jgi:hypothetical protein
MDHHAVQSQVLRVAHTSELSLDSEQATAAQMAKSVLLSVMHS